MDNETEYQQFIQELKLQINTKEKVENPYMQGEFYSENSLFFFAKGLVATTGITTDCDLNDMLKVVFGIICDEDNKIKAVTNDDEENKIEAVTKRFLWLCSTAYIKSGANLHEKKEARSNRKPKGESIKALEKIFSQTNRLRQALDDEPSPLIVEGKLLEKFKIEALPKKGEIIISSLDRMLLELEAIAKREITEISNNGNYLSPKPNPTMFIVEFNRLFNREYKKKLKYRYIAEITRACTNFEEITERHVERAINRNN